MVTSVLPWQVITTHILEEVPAPAGLLANEGGAALKCETQLFLLSDSVWVFLVEVCEKVKSSIWLQEPLVKNKGYAHV